MSIYALTLALFLGLASSH
jgi:hypothetical protein